MLHQMAYEYFTKKEPLQLSEFRSWSVLTVDLRVDLRYTHNDTKIATERPAVGVIRQNCAVNSTYPKSRLLILLNLNCNS